jgi:hypothetical protein
VDSLSLQSLIPSLSKRRFLPHRLSQADGYFGMAAQRQVHWFRRLGRLKDGLLRGRP